MTAALAFARLYGPSFMLGVGTAVPVLVTIWVLGGGL